jgi:hypothetical protein
MISFFLPISLRGVDKCRAVSLFVIRVDFAATETAFVSKKEGAFFAGDREQRGDINIHGRI